MQNIPKKISPCPIIEAVFEIKFETLIPSAAVLGLLYPQLSDQFQDINELPILQIPENIRTQNPNLKYQPSYQLSDGDKFRVQIGANIVTVSNVGEYVGWELFSEKIYFVLRHILGSKIPSKVIRFGLRYISFFDLNIFEKINFELTLDKSPFSPEHLVIGSLIHRNNFQINLQILNNASVPTEQRTGSVVDIDTYIENPEIELFQDTYKSLVDNAHTEEKELFFQLLKKDFLESFSPEY